MFFMLLSPIRSMLHWSDLGLLTMSLFSGIFVFVASVEGAIASGGSSFFSLFVFFELVFFSACSCMMLREEDVDYLSVTRFIWLSLWYNFSGSLPVKTSSSFLPSFISGQYTPYLSLSLFSFQSSHSCRVCPLCPQ